MYVRGIPALALSIGMVLLGLAQVYCSIWAPGRFAKWRWGKGGGGSPLSARSLFLWGVGFLLFGGISLFEIAGIGVLRFSWPLVVIVFVLLGWSGWKDNYRT